MSNINTRGRRPATQTQESVVETSNVEQVAPSKAPAKKDIISYNFKEDEGPKDAVYEIPKRAGIVYMINQTGVTVYDKDSDSVRQIRYCPNENSIFVDEQSPNAKKEAIVFRNGNLMVPKTKPNLKKFLEVHPGNFANGGTIFRIVDNRKNADDELKKEFEVFDSVALVRDKSIDELMPVAMYFNVNTERPANEIKFDLLRIAKNKPKEFIESFDNPSVKTRAIIHKASEYQIIKLRDSAVNWVDSGGMIVSVPVGQKPMDVMVRFCLTEKGSSVLASIEEQLGKI
jgi:hypothetical protein